MGQLINFPGFAGLLTGLITPSEWVAPTILTPPVLERIAASNAVARKVRALGYRIVDEDVSPDDGGTPILQVDLRGMPTRPLVLLSVCGVRNAAAGYERVTIDGVRVVWMREV